VAGVVDDLMLTVGERSAGLSPLPGALLRRGFVGRRCHGGTADDRGGCRGPPDVMQDLLTWVRCDDAAVRADVREFIGRQIGEAEAGLAYR
jgi:hypothetical protein